MSASIDERTDKKQLPPTHLIFFVLFLLKKMMIIIKKQVHLVIQYGMKLTLQSVKSSEEYASTLPASEPIPCSEAGKSY